MKFVYARASTKDQNLNTQLDALQKAGYGEISVEKTSGTIKDRPELTKMVEKLRQGDTVVVWSLDRLGCSLPHLIELMESFKKTGV